MIKLIFKPKSLRINMNQKWNDHQGQTARRIRRRQVGSEGMRRMEDLHSEHE